MILKENDLEILLQIAIDAAIEAGSYIQSRFSDEIAVEAKDAGCTLSSQVVTEVDYKCQEMILQQVQEATRDYDLGLLTEELDDDGSRLSKGHFWCIDPMDGTLCFIEKRRGYAVSVALVSKAGKPLIGVVYDPMAGVLYHAADGLGAYRNKKLWRLREAAGQEITQVEGYGAVMCACSALDEAPAFFVKQPKETEGGGCVWDYAATACIYKEIGGWVSDCEGTPLDLNPGKSLYFNKKGVLFASHHKIAEKHLNQG